MQPYQARVIEEHKELVEKRLLLQAFLNSATFDDINPAERGRLENQYCIMGRYIDVLADRIEHFE